MKKYSFKCLVSMGNLSIVETEEQRKAMSSFLKSFNMKPSIQKIETSPSKHDYYYESEIIYEDSDFLKILRFSESLRSFCLFWKMYYHECYLGDQTDV